MNAPATFPSLEMEESKLQDELELELLFDL
jgi:hypothetical protein